MIVATDLCEVDPFTRPFMCHLVENIYRFDQIGPLKTAGESGRESTEEGKKNIVHVRYIVYVIHSCNFIRWYLNPSE